MIKQYQIPWVILVMEVVNKQTMIQTDFFRKTFLNIVICQAINPLQVVWKEIRVQVWAHILLDSTLSVKQMGCKLNLVTFCIKLRLNISHNNSNRLPVAHLNQCRILIRTVNTTNKQFNHKCRALLYQTGTCGISHQ